MGNESFKVFVVEDDEWYRKLLEYNLSLNPDIEVRTFADGKSCLQALHENPDLITLDYRLPDLSGAEIYKRIKAVDEDLSVIVISEQSDIEVVVELLKEGVYDYIVKTEDIQNRLVNSINHLLRRKRLESELSNLRKEVARKYDFQKSIIGHSQPIRKVFDLIEKALQTNITVMITGETGTGKEVVAKAIHYNSKRKNKAFVAVNVAAIPPELMESELFGHEKGSFTGAIASRTGKFEEAHGGTLFLDEIGEMEVSMQAKLLRVLQEREIVRVGSNQPIKFNCRILTATHRDLRERVKEGKFREDLYYRLFGLPIELPPLRERGKDILLLARKFIKDFCDENEMELRDLSQDAQRKLMGYSFPGNIRELKSRIELAVVTSNGLEIGPDDILLGDEDILPDVLSNELTLREYNHRILSAYLSKYEQDIKQVSEKLDISVSTIYRMLKEIED